MHQHYEAPKFREIGSLERLTEQLFNKIGPSPDAVTATNPNVVGSFVPFP